MQKIRVKPNCSLAEMPRFSVADLNKQQMLRELPSAKVNLELNLDNPKQTKEKDPI